MTSQVNFKAVGSLKVAASFVYLLSALLPTNSIVHDIAASGVLTIGVAVPTLHWYLFLTKYERKRERLVVLVQHHLVLVPSVLAICAWTSTLSWTPFVVSAYVFWFLIGSLGLMFLYKAGSIVI